MIKIAQIIPGMNTGGREMVVLDIINNLNKDKFEIEIICLGSRGALSDKFDDTGLPVHYLNKKAGLSFFLIKKLSRIFKTKKYQIIHVHNPGTFIYGTISGLISRIPIIINSEHGYGHKLSKRKEIAESLLMNKIYLTLAVSDDLKKQILKRKLIFKARIKKLHNGVNLKLFQAAIEREEIRHDLGFDDHDIIIGAVGRLAKVKDHSTLILSMKQIIERYKNAKLIIVGDGELKHELENLIKEHDLISNVKLLGERNDVPNILNAIDIFVLSSVSEGISITLLEAMAARKAIVATAVGGNTEIIKNEENGLIVEPSDEIEMAEAIVRIIKNGQLKEKIEQGAKLYVNKNFCLKNMIKKIESIYEGALFNSK